MKNIIFSANGYGDAGSDPRDIPGSDRLLKLVSGASGWGLILCVAAIVIAAIIWAFGAQSSNQAQATQGKKGILIAILCASIIIAAPELVQWGVNFGTDFKAN